MLLKFALLANVRVAMEAPSLKYLYQSFNVLLAVGLPNPNALFLQ